MGLPFIVEPRLAPIIEEIGSEESGKISCERRGYLSSGEKAFVQQAIGGDDTTLKIIGLSRKIANECSSTLEVAYGDAISIISGLGSSNSKLKELEIKYFDEFNELMNSLATVQSKEQLIQAICMIKYRIDASVEVEEVMELHPDIIEGLSKLYKDEESKSVERLRGGSEDKKLSELSEEEVIMELEKKPRKRPVARLE